MKEEDLKKIYLRIVKEHPKIRTLKALHAIRTFVASNATKKEGLTARKISYGTSIPLEKVNRYVKYLLNYEYLHVTKSGRSRIFLSAEKKDGTFEKGYFDREGIEKTTNDKISEVIEAAEENPNLLGEEDKKDLEKLRSTKKFDSSSMQISSRLVEKLWKLEKLKHLCKISLRSTANRYSL